jgi:hypothetical protein
MIVTQFYEGQGLGNQLWCYAVTRCIAWRRKLSYGIMRPELFKGKSFLDIDMGRRVDGGSGPDGGPPTELPVGILRHYTERKTVHPESGIYIGKYDHSLELVQDSTKIDGVMQSLQYIDSFRPELSKWITQLPGTEVNWSDDDDICIVHVRGGDFLFSSAVLDRNYYHKAMTKMRSRNSKVAFFILTDDRKYAQNVCPGLPIVGAASVGKLDPHKAPHHIGGPVWIDWSIMRHARNVITSASSFSFWPLWLNQRVNVIAPMFWAAYKQSDGYWSSGDSVVDGWEYLRRDGVFFSSQQCKIMKAKYEETNWRFWQ